MSRLFSRIPPEGSLERALTPEQSFSASNRVRPSAARLKLTREGDPRSSADGLAGCRWSRYDLDAMDRALQAFHRFRAGDPLLGLAGRRKGHAPPVLRPPDDDAGSSGQTRSYLADETSFRVVREMHARNTIVPMVGDSGGRTRIRKVGTYVQRAPEHGPARSTGRTSRST